MKLSHYQKWRPAGREMWRSLAPSDRTDYNWMRLHLPGSIPSDEICRLQTAGELPDPPPFDPNNPRRRKRAHIPRQLRFRVLMRDNFTCQYCGAKAPEAVIELDHKLSIFNGGKDTEDNLVACCKTCNLGKSHSTLLVGA